MDYHHPDAPEAVALELLRIIEKAEPKDARRNVPEAARLLDLYAACLAAVHGDRMIPSISTQLLQ
jgi:hypothetical protein